MSIATIEDVEEFCPKCGSNNVVVEVIAGFYYFSICKKCGFRANGNSNKQVVNF